jgi:hypothetical protein
MTCVRNNLLLSASREDFLVRLNNILKNYTNQFINDRTKKAAKVKEAHLSKIKELEIQFYFH